MNTQFGKYSLIQSLGTSEMAEIFLARTPSGEKPVLIKKLHPALINTEAINRLFLNEARIAASLTHPNIIQVYDLGRLDNSHYMVMEYVEGATLRDIVKKTREKQKALPLEYGIKIIIEAAKGLSYAHNKVDRKGDPLNIIHGEICPQNLMLNYEGDVKVIDFGMNRVSEAIYPANSKILEGKIVYKSPEQLKGIGLSERSDLFSLGVLLLELATNQPVKEGADNPEAPFGKDPAELTASAEPERHFPDDLKTIIFKALSTDPEKRYATVKEFQDALEEFLVTHNLKATKGLMAVFLKDLFDVKPLEADKTEAKEMGTQTAEAAKSSGSSETGILRDKPKFFNAASGIYEVDQSRSKSMKASILIILLIAGCVIFYINYTKYIYQPQRESKLITKKPMPIPPSWILTIKVPALAQVYINNVLYPSQHPHTIVKGMAWRKEYELLVLKAGFLPYKKYILRDESDFKDDAHLTVDPILPKHHEEVFGKLEVQSDPPYDELYINNELIKTPVVHNLLAYFDYYLVLKKKGFDDIVQEFSVIPDKKAVIKVKFAQAKGEKEVAVEFKTFPGKGDVILNGKNLGKAPVKATLKTSRPYLISAYRFGFKEYNQILILNKWGVQKETVNLYLKETAKGYGKLQFTADPKLDVALSGDNKVKINASTPINELNLPVGVYKITVNKETSPFINLTDFIRIREDKQVTINWKFDKAGKLKDESIQYVKLK